MAEAGSKGASSESVRPMPRVLSIRDYFVNPGGLIYYVATDQQALVEQAARDEKNVDPTGHAGASLRNLNRDYRGFWQGELRWYSVE